MNPGRRQLLYVGSVVVTVAIVLWFFQGRVRATNHDIHIKEVMAGANGNSKIQFIVIEQEASGKNQWVPSKNINGFSNPPLFRKAPHLLDLSKTSPYGLSGDSPDLQTLATRAVIQHFTRTLQRSGSGPNPDFRLAAPDELAAITSITPDSGAQGGTVETMVTGTNLNGATAVTFS